MSLKTFVAVVACVMVAGMAVADSEMGHLKPRSVVAMCNANSAQLTWDAIADANLTGYNVYERQLGEPNYLKANPLPVTVPLYSAEGLASGTAYEFVVTAEYNDGQSSAPSEPATCTTG